MEQVNFLSLCDVSHPELSQIATLATGFSQKIVFIIKKSKPHTHSKTSCTTRHLSKESAVARHIITAVASPNSAALSLGNLSIAYDIKPNRALNLSKQNYHPVNKPTNSYVSSFITAALRNWTQVKSVWCACKTWLAFIATAGSHDQNF